MRMRVAYVTEYDATDVGNWSGLGYFIAKSLRDAGADVDMIGNLSIKSTALNAVKKLRYFYSGSTRWFMVNQSEKVARSYADLISERLQGNDVDCIFSPSSFPIAYVDANAPKVLYTDATFECMLNYYPSFSKLTTSCIERGHRIEKQALDSCALAIYSSEWAAKSAIEYYGINPEKVKVVPFGANLKPADAADRHSRKMKKPIEFLFIGSDWHRKGGDTVLHTCLKLYEKGVSLKLHIVGASPDVVMPSFVKCYGNLDKRKHADAEALTELYEAADFLFVPSLADCTPVVFAEAAAFGIPVITRQTGGITTMVKDGFNGIALPADATAIDYAEAITNLVDQPGRYEILCKNAFGYYQQKLNWKVAGTNLMNLLNDVVNKQNVAEVYE